MQSIAYYSRTTLVLQLRYVNFTLTPAIANYDSYYLAMYNRCLSYIAIKYGFILRCTNEANPILCNVTSGHVEVEQAPFAPAIASCYLAILQLNMVYLKSLMVKL